MYLDEKNSFHFHAGMTRHIERHNKDTRVLKYVCSVCGKAYRYAASLLKHKQSVHKQHKPYACNICGKGKTMIGVNMDVNLLIKTKVLMPIINHISSSGTSVLNMYVWFPLGLENLNWQRIRILVPPVLNGGNCPEN